MRIKLNKIVLLCLILLIAAPLGAKRKKPPHPFDHFDHEMHMAVFEGASVACETCHADPDSYQDHKKINRLGCHLCHNSPKPIIDVNKPCAVCHDNGPPKPPTHKVDWIARHQLFAKQNPDECRTCHTNPIFCVNCHQRRDTIQQTIHRRNFKFFHSIEARANPHKCDACHTVNFCQDCHAGRGR